MANLEDEEEQHLATLHELQATQEEIASYQGLLKDLPEIYERKFNERLKPILDRHQYLIDEREQLLHQLHQSLPPGGEISLLLTAAPQPPAAEDVAIPPTRQARGRPWWLLGLAALGVAIGLQLNKPGGSVSPPSPSQSSPIFPRPQTQQEVVPLPLATTLRGKVVARAMAEWNFFDRPTLQEGRLVREGRNEGDSGQWQKVISYWREGLFNDSLRDRTDVTSPDHPWSAAFISYVMRQAGAGDHFPYAASHSGSIKEAIYNRQNSVQNAKLIGHKIMDYAPRPGDILCATRNWATGQVTYDNAGQFDFFPSRCELVISVTAGQISTIGGDLLNAVTLRNIRAVNSRIAPEVAADWLVVLQTRLD